MTYNNLHRYLEDSEGNTVELSFSEIERILKRKLPKSAREHRAWWANTKSHSHAKAWMTPEWRVHPVVMPEEKVTFVRTKTLGNIRGKRSEGPTLVLEDALGFNSDLITIKTGTKRNRAKTIRTIREDLSDWMGNPGFETLRGKLLDLAIVVQVNKQRMAQQDLDNIAKITMDTLKKPEKPKDMAYLFNKDSQVVRLLLYKLPRFEHSVYQTDEMTISFREHNPEKEMILEEVEEI